MKPYLAAALAILAAASCGRQLKDGDYQLDILTTTDVHGSWFPTSYTDGGQKNSLHSVYKTIREYRDSLGADNIILLDATTPPIIPTTWTPSPRIFSRDWPPTWATTPLQ